MAHLCLIEHFAPELHCALLLVTFFRVQQFAILDLSLWHLKLFKVLLGCLYVLHSIAQVLLPLLDIMILRLDLLDLFEFVFCDSALLIECDFA